MSEETRRGRAVTSDPGALSSKTPLPTNKTPIPPTHRTPVPAPKPATDRTASWESTAETMAAQPSPPITGRSQEAASQGEPPRARAVVGDPNAPGVASAQVTYQGYLGESVGPYELLGILGLGGFGAVFRARHKRLHRMAAVKFLSPEAAKDPSIVQRFFVEAKAANDIHHENIVEVFDVDTHPTLGPYLVMELLEPGVSLAKEIGRGAMTEERAIKITRQVCSALEAAHRKGIVHRDLKPDNIFLITAHGQADVVKVLDFGIAKLVRQDDQVPGMKTTTGMVVGTPYYMSPEQCEGVNVDHRTDIYALGCILFQMLTQKVPFVGETYGVIFKHHILSAPPRVRSLRSEISSKTEKVILRCLEKDKEKRLQSMAEVAKLLTGEDLPKPPPEPTGLSGQWGAPVLSPPSSEATPLSGVMSSSGKKKNPLLWVGAAAFIFGGIVGGSYLLFPAKKEEKKATPAVQAPPTPTPQVASGPVSEPATPEAKTIYIVTEPPGAKVTQKGKEVGKTPLNVEEGVEIELSLDGYQPQTLTPKGALSTIALSPLKKGADAKASKDPKEAKDPQEPETKPPENGGEEVFVPKKKPPEIVIE